MTSGKERRKRRRHAEREMRAAWEALEKGERALAAKLARRAVEQGPMNPRLWRECGLLLAELGESAEAAEALRQAVRIAPTYREAFADLARLQAERGKFAAAARLQRRVVDLAPGDAAAQELAARYAERAGEALPASETEPRESRGDAATGPCDLGPFAALELDEVARRLETAGFAELGPALDAAGLAELAAFEQDPTHVLHELVLDETGPVVARVLAAPLPGSLEALERGFEAVAARLLARWDAGGGRRGAWFGGPAVVDVPPGVTWSRHEPVAGDAPALALALGLESGGGPVELLGEDVRFGRRRRARPRVLPLAAGCAAALCVGARPARLAGLLAWQPVRHGVRGGRVLFLEPFTGGAARRRSG